VAFEVIVSFEHDCDLIDVQRKIKQDFRVYCTGYYDFFIFGDKIPSESINSLMTILGYTGVRTSFNDYTLIFECTSDNRDHLMHFYNHIFRNQGIVFAYPEISDNKEIYLYHSLDSTAQSVSLANLQKLSKFTIESIKEYSVDEYYSESMFSISDIVDGLTKNQINLLTEAYKQGYYDIPRSIRTEDLGKQLNKSRYNIDKTIRIAESKIMKYVNKFLL